MGKHLSILIRLLTNFWISGCPPALPWPDCWFWFRMGVQKGEHTKTFRFAAAANQPPSIVDSPQLWFIKIAFPKPPLVKCTADSRHIVEVSQLFAHVALLPLLHECLDAKDLILLIRLVHMELFLLQFREVLESLEHEMCTSIRLSQELARIDSNCLGRRAYETVQLKWLNDFIHEPDFCNRLI